MWLSNLQIVLPDQVINNGAVKVENGIISEISDRAAESASLDGQGNILMPGFIDMHGDMIEREVEPRPQVRMPMELGLRDLDRKLATSGITTAYAALSFSPNSAYGHLRSYDHTSAVIRALKAMQHDLLVDHKVHTRMEITFPAALSVIEALIKENHVDLVSLTDHTPGQGQYRDIERMISRMQAEKGTSYEEAAETIAHRIKDRTLPISEMTTTLDAISKLCKEHQVALASHDDDTVEKVELMHALGADISEFPVTLEAARKAREKGLANAMGAPNALRGESYSGNLSAREAHREGLLDILAADYHPSAMAPAVLELAKVDKNGLAGAAKLSSSNAAKALGLNDRGTIETGKLADFVIVNPEGLGRPVMTIRQGRVIYSDGSFQLG